MTIAAPIPPPPALPAGLRSLLEGTGCVGACMERGSDWFERERPNLGMVSSVAAMVRAKLEADFVESLVLEPGPEALVRSRLQAVAVDQRGQSSSLSCVRGAPLVTYGSRCPPAGARRPSGLQSRATTRWALQFDLEPLEALRVAAWRKNVRVTHFY